MTYHTCLTIVQQLANTTTQHVSTTQYLQIFDRGMSIGNATSEFLLRLVGTPLVGFQNVVIVAFSSQTWPQVMIYRHCDLAEIDHLRVTRTNIHIIHTHTHTYAQSSTINQLFHLLFALIYSFEPCYQLGFGNYLIYFMIGYDSAYEKEKYCKCDGARQKKLNDRLNKHQISFQYQTKLMDQITL